MQRNLLVLLALLAPACVPANAQSAFFLNRRLGEWLDQLESAKQPASRRSAAFALGRMGSIAGMAIQELARRISDDPDAGVRDMSAAALGDIVLSMRHFSLDEQWKKAGEPLTAALGHDDPRVRRSAAYALGAFGSVAASAAPSLKKALRDSTASVRQNAAWALGRIGAAADGPMVADLCDLLRDSSALVRRDAAAALKTVGEKTDAVLFKIAVKPLLEMVNKERDEVARNAALETLATRTGPEHADLAGDVYPLLERKDPNTVRNAAFVLGNMGGEPARRALPELKKALRDTDPAVQELAAASLSHAGKEAIPAIDDLARVLTTSAEPKVRVNCAVALGHIGGENPAAAQSAVPALADALKATARPGDDPSRKYEYDKVRIYAAEALSRFRPPYNEAAIPAVREAIRGDPSRDVRYRCVWATFNMREEAMKRFDLIPVLAAVLEETSPDTQLVRYEAARSLAVSLGARAPDKVCDVLLDMIGNTDLQVFKGTDAAITSTTDESRGGGSKVSEKAEGDGRHMAAEAMGWLGDKAKKNKSIVAALQKAAKSDERQLREKAREALKRIGLALE
jgi:HEAT repeat protein